MFGLGKESPGGHLGPAEVSTIEEDESLKTNIKWHLLKAPKGMRVHWLRAERWCLSVKHHNLRYGF
jgi:hypothetical protein